MRVLSILLLLITLTSYEAVSKEKWLTTHYKHFEFQSSLSEKQTQKVVTEFHYFVQATNNFFPKLGILGRFPVRIVLTDRARTFNEYTGGKLDTSRAHSVYGSVDGFETIVVYVKNKNNATQTCNLLFGSIAEELFRESEVLDFWFMRGMSFLLSTTNVTSHGLINLGKPIDLRFEKNPDTSERFDTKPTLLTSHFLTASDFFDLSKRSPVYENRTNRAIANIQSWLCLHYAVFNEDPSMIKRLIRYAIYCKNNDYTPESFQEIMGISGEEFLSDVKRYAERGKYAYTEIKKEDLPAPKSIAILPANIERILSTKLAMMLSTRNWEKSINLLKQLNSEYPSHPDILEASFFAHQKIDTRWVEQKGIIDGDPDEDLLKKATREFNRLQGYERRDLDEILREAIDAGVSNYKLQLTMANRMIQIAQKENRLLQMKEIAQINRLLAPTLQKKQTHLEALRIFVQTWAISSKPAPEKILPHIVNAMKAHPQDRTIWENALIVFEQTRKHADSVAQIQQRLDEINLAAQK